MVHPSPSCGPTNLTGPFEQTLFLGCSIQSVSTSLGWNEQQSTVTVTLVEDTCAATEDHPKVYYPGPGRKYCWHDPDPGFTNPTIGAPVYFRIGSDPAWPINENDKAEGNGFEFAGIIQSWTKDYSPNGNPVYTVTIVDPRMLLNNLQIIVSDYAGSAYGGSGPPIYNLINAYGWLEWATTAAAGKGGTLDSCPQTFVQGAQFGSPANGFGGSKNNNEGTPWHDLKPAIQYLLSGQVGKAAGNISPNEDRFSPYGLAKFRGSRPQRHDDEANPGDFIDTDESSNSKDRHGLQGMGILNHDDVNWSLTNTGSNAHGLPYIADYYIDIYEIPFAPRWFRLAGPNMSLLDMITQICNQCGCDFYIELIVTKSEQKIIKVRAVERAAQPEVGGPNGIEQFVLDQKNVTSKNVSRELRNENTSTFIYGGYVQTVYQQVIESGILQYWGKDSLGVHHTYTRLGLGTAADAFYNTSGYNSEVGDWAVYLDVRPLNLNLSTTLGVNYIWISENEMRLALGDFDAWYNYCLIYKAFAGTPMGAILRARYGAKQNIEFPKELMDAGIPDKALANAFENLIAGGFAVNFSPQDPESTNNSDLKKIHEYIQNWSDTFYGKQFLVQLPYVCWYNETDSAQILFSDTPTNDGGYPAEDATNVLDLPWQEGATPTPLDFFSDESNKILPFARYFAPHTGAYPREGEWVAQVGCCRISTNSVYVKGTVEEKPVPFTTAWGEYATALFKTDNPIETSGASSKFDELYNGIVKIAAGRNEFSTDQIESLKFAVRFQPDGGRSDGASMTIAPRRRQPNEIAVPMKSNTTRYGPYSWAGPPGPVAFHSDDGLVPWEYGGYSHLWPAMVESAAESLTFQQVGERGSVNFPGYPIRRLGQELRSNEGMMEFMSLQYEDFNMLGGGSEAFTRVELLSWKGTFGPNITNITINIGAEGFTTNYTLSTYTASFGRFAKYNANKLKQAGQQRAQFQRMQREQNKLRKAVMAAQARASAQIKNLKGRKPTKQAGDGPPSLVAGTNSQLAQQGAGQSYAIPNASSPTPRTLLFGNPDTWSDQAFMSQDGLIRPVSNAAGSSLPRYTSKNAGNPKDTCAQIPHTRRESNPPFNGDSSYVPCIIDIDYLDPWSYPSKAKHDANSSASTNHNDINIFSHGAAAVAKINLYEYVADGNSYPTVLRGMANKGPLLLHGWGYDIDGKPIPNAADTETAASGGTFEDEDLQDKFLSHYLRKPHTWPVGPVDLRWDRKRAVWTTPSEFKIIKAKTTGGPITPGGCRTDVITTQGGVGARMGDASSNPVYDANGAEFDGNIKVCNPNFQPEIPSGESFYAIYDSIACMYYPIYSSGGSGDCISGKNISCVQARANYCGDANLDGSAEAVAECMSGLVAGPGLYMYKVTGDTEENGMHYLETALTVSSGCTGDPNSEQIRAVENIYLGCGLSGAPTHTCGGDADNKSTGVCGVQIELNPLACHGPVTNVRYVYDICCSGAGIEVIYKHLHFSSCGLFTGVTGEGSCS